MSDLIKFFLQHVAQVLQKSVSKAGMQAYVQFRIKKDGTKDDMGLVSVEGEVYLKAFKMVNQMPRYTYTCSQP